MYAVIETGGKQLRVEEGQAYFVEKLDVNAGDEVVIDKVVLFAGETTKIGTPYVEGAKVTGKVLKHGKNKKIRIFKYVNKKKSTRKSQGHRQPYTKVEITKING